MLLAVYGTLRRGEVLSNYLDGIRERGTTEVMTIPGIKLFIAGLVPGAKVTNDPKDKAVIELIDSNMSKEAEENVLDLLDEVEGVYYGLYERDLIDTPRGKATIYTKCGEIGDCVELTDWKEWQKMSKKDKLEALEKSGQQAVLLR